MPRSWLLLLPFLAVPLSAQSAPKVYPVNVRALSCPAADSLLGSAVSDAHARLWRHFLPELSRMLVENPMPPFTSALGIQTFRGRLVIQGDTAAARTGFQLELKVISAAPRPIEERQLSFVGDDTLYLDIGSMTAETQDFPGVRGTVENMAVVVPFVRIAPLLRTRKIRLTLGSTRYDLSTLQRRELVSVVTAGLCGWRPE